MNRKDLLPTAAHGSEMRGLAAGALPGLPFGRFGRMLSPCSARRVPEAALAALAAAMIRADRGTPIVEREPDDENGHLPAGYTYFGQFVDHDISFDPTPFATTERDSEALVDFRSPALDLDSVYGRGPDDQPYLYEPGTLRLRVGAERDNGGAAVGSRHDLFRLPDGTALLGDKRNDENKIVSQVHGVLVALHNKVVERDALLAEFGFAEARPESRFSAAATLVRWHYQWTVVHDYLRRITQPGTVQEILHLGHTPRLRHYLKGAAEFPYMPVEFSGAAFRFGHSQVRPSYSLNNDALTAIKAGADPLQERIPTFARVPEGVQDADRHAQNLNGFPGTLPEKWGIDWSFFLPGLATPRSQLGEPLQLPQPSYRIDANLVDPLADLPEFFTEGPHGRGGRLFANLAFRNLLRGQNLGLPSGQQAAAELGIEPLDDEVIWGAGSRSAPAEQPAELRETAARRTAVSGPFERNAPLWFYILREAEYFGVEHDPQDPAIAFGGQHLGPVGSRIVAETFIGLLWLDKRSFLNAHRPFQPLDAVSGGGPLDLAALVRFALSD